MVCKISIDKIDSDVLLGPRLEKRKLCFKRQHSFLWQAFDVFSTAIKKTIDRYKSSKIDKAAGNFGSKIQFSSEKWVEVLLHTGQLCSFY